MRRGRDPGSRRRRRRGRGRAEFPFAGARGGQRRHRGWVAGGQRDGTGRRAAEPAAGGRDTVNVGACRLAGPCAPLPPRGTASGPGPAGTPPPPLLAPLRGSLHGTGLLPARSLPLPREGITCFGGGGGGGRLGRFCSSAVSGYCHGEFPRPGAAPPPPQSAAAGRAGACPHLARCRRPRPGASALPPPPLRPLI